VVGIREILESIWRFYNCSEQLEDAVDIWDGACVALLCEPDKVRERGAHADVL